jgi:predicted MarR family transcription regulator
MVDKTLPNTWSMAKTLTIGDIKVMTKSVRTLQAGELVEIHSVDTKKLLVESVMTGHKESVGHDCIE